MYTWHSAVTISAGQFPPCVCVCMPGLPITQVLRGIQGFWLTLSLMTPIKLSVQVYSPRVRPSTVCSSSLSSFGCWPVVSNSPLCFYVCFNKHMSFLCIHLHLMASVVAVLFQTQLVWPLLVNGQFVLAACQDIIQSTHMQIAWKFRHTSRKL